MAPGPGRGAGRREGRRRARGCRSAHRAAGWLRRGVRCDGAGGRADERFGCPWPAARGRRAVRVAGGSAASGRGLGPGRPASGVASRRCVRRSECCTRWSSSASARRRRRRRILVGAARDAAAVDPAFARRVLAAAAEAAWLASDVDAGAELGPSRRVSTLRSTRPTGSSPTSSDGFLAFGAGDLAAGVRRAHQRDRDGGPGRPARAAHDGHLPRVLHR